MYDFVKFHDYSYPMTMVRNTCHKWINDCGFHFSSSTYKRTEGSHKTKERIDSYRREDWRGGTEAPHDTTKRQV